MAPIWVGEETICSVIELDFGGIEVGFDGIELGFGGIKVGFGGIGRVGLGGC